MVMIAQGMDEDGVKVKYQAARNLTNTVTFQFDNIYQS